MSDQSSPSLRKLREDSNHTQVQVADLLQVDQSVVSQWETGSAPLPLGQVPLMAKILGVSQGAAITAGEAARQAWLAGRDLRLAEELRWRRETAGLTQAQVAEACDCSASSVTLWENGTTRPDRSRLEALCDLFDVQSAELLACAGFDEAEVVSYLEPDTRDVTVLAALLRDGRVAAELSQVQVAAALGSSQNSISAIEKAIYLPAPVLVAGMTRLYGLDRLEVMAARYETLRELGHIEVVALPWPLRPADVPCVRWFRQLRAHLGSTRGELAEALGVDGSVVREAEIIETAGLPIGLRSSDALGRLATIAGCELEDLVVAWEPEVADLAHLLSLEGQALVDACENVGQLLRLLYFRGMTWTEIGEAAGTSRQSPINWSRGSVPSRERVIGLGALFDPPVSPAAMEALWVRSKRPARKKGVKQVPEPVPGTPDWVFAESRLDAGKGED